MRIRMKRAAPKDTESDSSPDAASDVKPVKRKGKVVLTYEFTCQDCKQGFMKQSAVILSLIQTHLPKQTYQDLKRRFQTTYNLQGDEFPDEWGEWVSSLFACGYRNGLINWSITWKGTHWLI
jgi:hypothetical protein